MATYAIGDVHGCFRTLERLLAGIRFDPRRDRLWLTGDLVNRGPRSLEVLRWARSLDHRLTVVLGNHDLHLLARASGRGRAKRRDTLDAVLAAPDRDELLSWLARRPLVHRRRQFLLVHAGLFPAWSLAAAVREARLTEASLAGPQGPELLAAVERDVALAWREDLVERERRRVALAAFTGLRTLTSRGRLCPGFSGPPADSPPGCVPWFDLPSRRPSRTMIVFGHWAALGLCLREGLAGLDTGCVWGGELTALRLDDGAVFQQQSCEDG